GPIALGQVRPDQRSVCTLSERLARDRRQRRLDRTGNRSQRHEPLAYRLERVEPELPEALPLDYHPFVGPAGNEVPLEQRQVELGILNVLGSIEDPPRELERFPIVHRDVGWDGEIAVLRIDEVRG